MSGSVHETPSPRLPVFYFILHLFNVLAITREGVLRVDTRPRRGGPRLKLEDSVKKYMVGVNERVIRNVKMSDG